MRSYTGCEVKLSCKALAQRGAMEKENIFILVIFILGFLTLLYSAYQKGIDTSNKYENLEKICLKAYKTDLKNDSEIKQLCAGVTVPLSELETVGALKGW